MRGMRRRITLGILASAVILIAAVLWFNIRHSSGLSRQTDLLARLPNQPAAVLSIDFSTLRRAGMLSARSMPIEPEYKAFLSGTGFDYHRDLDFVVASFSDAGNFFVARGRFDWAKLRDYAIKQGGSCYDQLCRVQGSTPKRRISFLPLRDNVIALAVSTDDLAATRLRTPNSGLSSQLPNTPVWLSVSGQALSHGGALPEGIRVTLSGLMETDHVLLTAGPGPRGIEAHLETTCRSLDAARTLESQLRSSAAVLKDALARSKTKDETLAGVLSAGSFARDAKKVTGIWRIDPAIIEGLTDGI
jgi:hypothetical protein